MIASLSGRVSEKSAEGVVIDVGGVGYDVQVPLSTFYSLPEEGEEAHLLIYTYVKEDALKLFGFLTPREKKLFIKLIGISGVGPKLGLGILSGMETEDLVAAIAGGDVARINAIPGVGKKTADRLIVELRDKLKLEALTIPAREGGAARAGDHFDDALSALVNLGYKRSDVEKTLETIRRRDEGEAGVESLIRESLKMMAK